MIRSLGSSLLAKAGSGSLSRKKDEARIVKPDIPGKGAVGTAARDLTQETNITPVAPGSEKIIRSAPGIESASLPGMAANQVPLVAGMGTPGGAAPVPAGNQPMLRSEGGGAPASQAGQGGRQAQVASTAGAPTGAIATAKAAQKAEQARVLGAQANVQGERIPFGGGSLPDIGIFGSRVSAAGDGGGQPQSNDWQPTTGQYISGAVGKAIDKIGNALGNPLPNLNVSENLQKFGGSKSVAAAGKGSVGTAAQNIGNALRSVVNQVKNTFSNLRSKWGW